MSCLSGEAWCSGSDLGKGQRLFEYLWNSAQDDRPPMFVLLLLRCKALRLIGPDGIELDDGHNGCYDFDAGPLLSS